MKLLTEFSYNGTSHFLHIRGQYGANVLNIKRPNVWSVKCFRAIFRCSLICCCLQLQSVKLRIHLESMDLSRMASCLSSSRLTSLLRFWARTSE